MYEDKKLELTKNDTIYFGNQLNEEYVGNITKTETSGIRELNYF